jgi:Fic family protein
MTDATHAAILAELEELYHSEKRQPEEVDAYEMSTIWGISSKAASNRLNLLVEKGEYTKRKWRRKDGYPLTLWRKAVVK